MNTINRPELFTKTKRCVTMYRLNRNNRYFLYQRYRLALKKDLNAGILVLLLNDYFPGLVFIPPNSNDDISIAHYVVQKHGKWTLDIHAMSKSKEKIFSCLFPEKISCWNEAEARKRYGCADIIRFFVDTENDMFSAAAIGVAKNLGGSIPRHFFDELDYSGKPVWEDWNFSALVIHRMRHRPPSIYEAFGYYAHRRYTLMGFGRGSGNTEDELIQAGARLLNDVIREQIPETANFGIDRLTAFFEMIQETLESVPSGSSIYVPTKLNVFMNQLKTKIADLYKASHPGKAEDMADTYSAADRKTINNHIEKAEEYGTDGESLLELQKIKLSGTYREKVNLLHRIVFAQPPQGYSQRELSIIHALFLKQYRSVSLDQTLGGSDDGDTYTGYDMIGDERYTRPDDHLAWSSLFRDEFVQELDKDALEKFIECIPDHFSRHPFDVDSDGALHISKYSRKILFSTFCSAAGIFQEDELWKPFLVLLQRVVDNINGIRRM